MVFSCLKRVSTARGIPPGQTVEKTKVNHNAASGMILREGIVYNEDICF
jgi:hypothetical protein